MTSRLKSVISTLIKTTACNPVIDLVFLKVSEVSCCLIVCTRACLNVLLCLSVFIDFLVWCFPVMLFCKVMPVLFCTHVATCIVFWQLTTMYEEKKSGNNKSSLTYFTMSYKCQLCHKEKKKIIQRLRDNSQPNQGTVLSKGNRTSMLTDTVITNQIQNHTTPENAEE